MKRAATVFFALCVFLSAFSFSALAEKPVPDGAVLEPEAPHVGERRPLMPTPTSIDKDYLPIEGVWGEEIPIHNGVYRPFLLDERMSYCMEMTMVLSISGYTGYPFGDWYLYALDMEDNWYPLGAFRIEKEQADGEIHTCDFSFFPPETFKALAICSREKGAVFTLDFDMNFYAP